MYKFVVSLAVLILLGVSVKYFGSESAAVAPQTSPAAIELDSATFESLSWDELPGILSHMGTDVSVAQILGELAELDGEVANYLRGLLLLSEGSIDKAAEQFSLLNPQTIPPSLLYAPFRVLEFRNPPLAKQFMKVMEDSIYILPEIQQARLQARQGELKKSLISYGGSDPASWSTLDVQNFGMILRHNGLNRDARILIQGAANGGRLKDNVLELFRSVDYASEESNADLIAKWVKGGEESKQLLIRSVTESLNRRKLFFSGDYQELVDLHGMQPAASASNETVMLLLVASAAIQQDYSYDKWALELKRRFPDAETHNWVENLMVKES
jgi:hypothetical protein